MAESVCIAMWRGCNVYCDLVCVCFLVIWPSLSPFIFNVFKFLYLKTVTVHNCQFVYSLSCLYIFLLHEIPQDQSTAVPCTIYDV